LLAYIIDFCLIIGECFITKIDKLKELQDKQITDTTKQWDDLITAVTTGTMSYQKLMSSWYGQTIKDMEKYNSDVASQLATLKTALADLLSTNSAISSASNSTNTTKTVKSYTIEITDPKTKKTTTTSVKTKAEADKLVAANKGKTTKIIPKYHVGGIVGEGIVSAPSNRLAQLANKIFNVQPGEMLTKQLIGELDIPPKNIPNLFTNINNMVNSLLPKNPTIVQSGDTITLNNVTIQTKDASTFLPDLQRIISTRKS
jgi:hypothetical protein